MKVKRLLPVLAELLGPSFLRLLYVTLRIRVISTVPDLKLRNILLVFWHGKMLVPLKIHQGTEIYMMISEHKDGELITNIIRKFGIKAIRGSSTRGAKKAYIGMLRKLKDGKHGGITPDGPKGPRHEVKPGAVRLSLDGQTEMLLINWHCERKWQFKSWDKFEVPKPFAKVYVSYLRMPVITKTENIEEVARQVQIEMHALEEACKNAAQSA
jgi:lysophospholipid acyltransferase (LPLAT)-like uncharacterized protein